MRSMRKRQPKMEGLVVAGLTELAMGALTGWPMALAVSRPDDLERIGIRSGARLRQWHLDLIMLGRLTALAPKVVPDPPRAVAAPLAVGAWTNASAFGVLAFRPELKDPAYRASVIGSFIATTWGFTGLAGVAWRRWRAAR